MILFESVPINAADITRPNINKERLRIRRYKDDFKDSFHIGIDNRYNQNIIGEDENCWLQIGDVLGGATLYDGFGSSVDLSSVIVNNTLKYVTLAAGAFGHATIFNYTFSDGHMYDGEWTQIGDKIMGQDERDEFGKSISLSSNGRIVAVGAPLHAVNGSSYVGHVRIYSYDTESGNISHSWTQLGQDIDGYVGGEQFGYSLDLSGDGRTVIIGTNQANHRNIRIFRYNEMDNSWNPLGVGIESSTLEKSGGSTSISDDGRIVAIGSPHGSMTRIFQLISSHNNVNETWTQIGNDIVGETSRDRSGVSISLSFNGTIIAIGAELNKGSNGFASGHVRVYSYNSSTDHWEQFGQDIDGEDATDFSGSAVSLSDDGLTVAIGAWSNDAKGENTGHVRVYRFESNEWKMYGHDIDGASGSDAFGRTLSLSQDGQLVAIGSMEHDSVTGHVRIFAKTNESCIITSPPSLQPSLEPSQSPSGIPSQQPSLTQSPSKHPSQSPSEYPSKPPSQSPSGIPSQQPSLTQSPSEHSSQPPSKYPSKPSSQAPSGIPSQQPSLSPKSSRNPSSRPSVSPSISQNVDSTASPRGLPSMSGKPSRLPSTGNLYASPSSHPTVSPSTLPSSVFPSVYSSAASIRAIESDSLAIPLMLSGILFFGCIFIFVYFKSMTAA